MITNLVLHAVASGKPKWGGGVGRGLDLTKKKVFFGMVMYNFAKKELEGAGGGGGAGAAKPLICIF